MGADGRRGSPQVWIASETGYEPKQVKQVLALETEFHSGVGIIEPPLEKYLYYSRSDFDELSQRDAGDLDRIARDSHQKLGTPIEAARRILDAETRYLQLRGIAK
jgi:hypothetical protein